MSRYLRTLYEFRLNMVKNGSHQQTSQHKNYGVWDGTHVNSVHKICLFIDRQIILQVIDPCSQYQKYKIGNR